MSNVIDSDPSNHRNIYPYSDGVEIAERLSRKSVEVKVYNVFHEGTTPRDLESEFAKFDIRTVEDPWGSIWSPSTTNSIDAMLVGLGPNPKHQLETSSNVIHTSNGNHYLDSIEKQYRDIRGVDQTLGGDWLEAIYANKVRVNTLNLPGLTTTYAEMLTKRALGYCLNSYRDLYQAYFISKILDLFTYNKDSAKLAHIGGSNHIALPIFLREFYRIKVVEVSINNAEADAVTKLLAEVIPLQEAYQYIKSVDRRNLNFDHFALSTKIAPVSDRFQSALG